MTPEQRRKMEDLIDRMDRMRDGHPDTFRMTVGYQKDTQALEALCRHITGKLRKLRSAS